MAFLFCRARCRPQHTREPHLDVVALGTAVGLKIQPLEVQVDLPADAGLQAEEDVLSARVVLGPVGRLDQGLGRVGGDGLEVLDAGSVAEDVRSAGARVPRAGVAALHRLAGPVRVELVAQVAEAGPVEADRVGNRARAVACVLARFTNLATYICVPGGSIDIIHYLFLQGMLYL